MRVYHRNSAMSSKPRTLPTFQCTILSIVMFFLGLVASWLQGGCLSHKDGLVVLSSQVGRKKRAVRKYAFLLPQRKSFPRSPPVGFSLNLFDQNWVTWPRKAGKVHIRKESARGKMGLGLYPQGLGWRVGV